jgi:hypothetical protein
LSLAGRALPGRTHHPLLGERQGRGDRTPASTALGCGRDGSDFLGHGPAFADQGLQIPAPGDRGRAVRAHASARSGCCEEPRYPAPALVLALFPRKKGRPVKGSLDGQQNRCPLRLSGLRRGGFCSVNSSMRLFPGFRGDPSPRPWPCAGLSEPGAGLASRLFDRAPRSGGPRPPSSVCQRCHNSLRRWARQGWFTREALRRFLHG